MVPLAQFSVAFMYLLCKNSSFKYYTNLYFMQIIYIFFSWVYAFIPLLTPELYEMASKDMKTVR